MELHRLLGDLYRDTDDPSVQADITEFLSAAALESTDKDIVNSAARVHSQLGYSANSLAVLEHAYKLGAITVDLYFGDMAHMLPSAPPKDQLILLKNIEAGNNRFARDVLAQMLADPAAGTALSSEVRAATARLLASWEPDPGALRDM
jgi:hypothetical protein